MNEADLKTALCAHLRAHLPVPNVVARHEPGLGATPGWPDISAVTKHWFGLEVKFLRRGTQKELEEVCPKLQYAMIRRLWQASQGRCVYVIYTGGKAGKSVGIYTPADVDGLWLDSPLMLAGGFDHQLVANFIEEHR